MTPKLKQYLNRTIMVSIPALFKDVKCRAYTLQAVEEGGLWLTSAALVDRLLPEREQATDATTPAIYVPAGQIGALILTPSSAGAPQVSKPDADTKSKTTT
jgi:hypothetical protein